jgi:chlorobactene glucosyltransferase
MFELHALSIVAIAAWFVVLLWLVGAFLTWRGLVRQLPLEAAGADGKGLKRDDAPPVSVLVPARNEEGRVLKLAVASMLAQDYGNYEVVAVNDRSTDGTSAILHEMAVRDERLRVIDGAEPPAGWLGKPHALQQALNAAHGEWALATDADMIFAPEVVRTAVALALSNGYEAVTLIPHIVCLSFWERVFMPAFGWFMVMGLPVHRVNDPNRKVALGVGGFFMIKREALRRVGEYGAVRAEVAEDLRMAEILKAAGVRLRLEYAPDLASTRMQTNFREIWEGFTKNIFAGVKFNFAQAIGAAAGILLVAVAPVIVAIVCAIALVLGASTEWWRLLVPTFLVWLVQVLIFATVNKRWDLPVVYALTVPLGHALFVAILINSALRIKTGRGVTWKGRKLYERAGVRPPRDAASPPDLPIADD